MRNNVKDIKDDDKLLGKVTKLLISTNYLFPNTENLLSKTMITNLTLITNHLAD